VCDDSATRVDRLRRQSPMTVRRRRSRRNGRYSVCVKPMFRFELTASFRGCPMNRLSHDDCWLMKNWHGFDGGLYGNVRLQSLHLGTMESGVLCDDGFLSDGFSPRRS